MSIQDAIEAAKLRRIQNIRDALSSFTPAMIRAVIVDCLNADRERIKRDPNTQAEAFNWLAYGLGMHWLVCIADEVIREKEDAIEERN